ncbi:alpha/beta hydrolase [Oscillospiraceae bacterium 42-9]
MPKCQAGDIAIMYEAYGSGETVVYLQSVLGGLNPGAYYFAGRLSRRFRVLIWDGPNCGQSGVSLPPAPSEYHLACGYLAKLLDALGEGPVHLAGCSGGGEMGLLFAHLYPGRVKSLGMYRPTDTASQPEQEVIRARYFDIAQAAEHSMEQAVKLSQNPPPHRFAGASRWLAELCQKDREKIFALDHKAFSRTLRNWGEWMGNPLFYRANLTDEELGELRLPVLVCPCSDDFHPERLAVDLKRKLPACTYIPSEGHRSEQEIYGTGENGFGGFPRFVDHYERFLEGLVQTTS